MTYPGINQCRAARYGTKLALIGGIFVLSACNTPSDTRGSASPETAEPAAADTQVEQVETVTIAPEASPTPSAEAPSTETVLATGTFEGRSDHVVTGGVDIVESDGRYLIKLAADFSLDNAPDPKVGLGNDGYDPATKAGHLKALTGASTYEVPAGINIQEYNEVYIWCERFGVPLGLAQVQRQ